MTIACPVWTEDADFFGAGVATWTTDRVAFYLGVGAKKHARELVLAPVVKYFLAWSKSLSCYQFKIIFKYRICPIDRTIGLFP